MKIKEGLILLSIALLLGVLQISFGYASFSLHNEKVQREYVGGEQIKGKINISLRNEPFNNMITSNFVGGIKLIDFLLENELEQGEQFNCTSEDCGMVYGIKNSITSASVENGKDLLIGFKIKDEDVVIKSLDFNINSDLGSSCTQSFKIFVFADNETPLMNNNYVSGGLCGTKNFGCFQNNLETSNYQEAIVTQEPYCEKISLEPAPACMVGAEINAVGNTSSLIFDFYNNETEHLKSCSVTNIKTGLSSVSCVINQSVLERGEYYICVYSNANKNEYKIRSEREENICGGAGVGRANRDYEIFAQPLLYSALKNFSAAKAFRDIYKMDLGERADSYIAEKYGRDCSNDEGCVIPFLIRGVSQNLVFENISIFYEGSGAFFTGRELYKLEEKPSLISTNMPVELDLKYANLSIPVSSKEQYLQILLGENQLFSRAIKINITPGFDFDVSPKVAVVGIETTFVLRVNQNLTSVQWDFGDGTKKTTQTKEVAYRFTNASEVELKVTVTNTKGISITKTFLITAENPKEGAKILLNQTKTKFDNLQRSINSLEPSIKEMVKNEVNITEIQNDLKKIEEDYNNASSDEEYTEVIRELLSLEIAKEIRAEDSLTLPLSVGLINMDIDYIEIVANKSFESSKKEKLKEAVVHWNNNVVSGKASLKKVSVVKEEPETLFSILNLSIYPVREFVSRTYLILDYPYEDIISPPNDIKPLEKGALSGVYTEVQGKKEINLIIKDDIEIEDVGFYLAPSELSVFGSEYVTEGPIEKPKLPTKRLLLYILLLIFGFLVVYIILQEWYKRNYEKSLFKNPDELYNLIHFIYNSRKMGIGEDETKNKLLKTGWSREQISYATKKLDGKRTGMLEIPIFRPFERRKVANELAKRGG